MTREQRPYLILALAVVFVSLGSLFIRLAQAPALAVSFYRIFLASLILAPFGLSSGLRSWPGLTSRQRFILLGCGVALALHFATWIASLGYTSVAASVLLVNTAPIFTVILSRVFLGETPTRVVLGATLVAVAGAAIIAGGDWSSGRAPIAGDLLALAGAVTLSVYHVIGRGLRGAMPLAAYVLAVWSTAAATLAVLAVALGVPLLGLPARAYGFFVALALLPTLGGHGLVNVSLRSLPAPVVGLFLLGEPIGASALAYVFLGETPTPSTLAGGLVVLAALGTVVLAGTR